MSPEAQRIAIATACGWRIDTDRARHTTPCGATLFANKDALLTHLPDYLNDLNATASAIRSLIYPNRALIASYCAMLDHVAGSWLEAYFTSPAQQCEALLRTLNLYTDNTNA